MSSKRAIKAKDLVNGIRGGLTDAQLMEQYGLSSQGLQRAFRKLVDARCLSQEELESRSSSGDDTIDVENLRRAPRNYPAFPIPIGVADNLALDLCLIDITEHGIQVTGVEAVVGETKEFVIRADELHDIFPFAFKAQCRWVNPGESREDTKAGFEIMEITPKGRKHLKNVINKLTLSVQSSEQPETATDLRPVLKQAV